MDEIGIPRFRDDTLRTETWNYEAKSTTSVPSHSNKIKSSFSIGEYANTEKTTYRLEKFPCKL